MKSGDFRLTVEWEQAGQPRAYADSIYQFVLTAEWIPYGKTELEPVQWFPEVGKSYARGIKPWKDAPAWHESRLKSFNTISPGKWRVTVIEPYCD